MKAFTLLLLAGQSYLPEEWRIWFVFKFIQITWAMRVSFASGTNTFTSGGLQQQSTHDAVPACTS